MEKKNDKGFTLVELLILLVILGVLAAVAVVALRGISVRGDETSCQVEKRTIEAAIDMYDANEGVPPESFEALVGGLYLSGDAVTLAANWALVSDTTANHTSLFAVQAAEDGSGGECFGQGFDLPAAAAAD